MRGWPALVAIALVLAGCSGWDRVTTPAHVVAEAALKTTNASTAHVTLTVTAIDKAGRPIGEGSRTGVVDGTRHRGVLDFDFSFVARPRSPLDREALVGTVTYYGDRLFLSTGALMQTYASGDNWFEMTPEQFAASRSGLGGLPGLSSPDPTNPVEYLRATQGDGEALGTGRVYGTPTKRYRVVVDFRRYLELIPITQRGAAESTVNRLGALTGSTRFPVTVWIASDGTIRRVDGEIPFRPGSSRYTLELSAIGDPQRLHRPLPFTVNDIRSP